MARRIQVSDEQPLARHEEVAHLAPAVQELRTEAKRLTPALEGRTVWMVNSAPKGGGVAEMLPGVVAFLRELGVRTEWAVIESDDSDFFALTKTIHNLVHGTGAPELGGDARRLYEEVNRKNARDLRAWMSDGDILVVHDPQPMPLAKQLREELDLRTLWRCHIGVDVDNEATRAAWAFLAPYADAYHHAVFSSPEYIPDYLAGRSTVLFPAIDPLNRKNHELSLHKIVGILANGALAVSPGPVLTPPYPEGAERLQPDGNFVAANQGEDIGLLQRPIVTQISRWDRLKGFEPLMEAFTRLKRRGPREDADSVHRRRMDLVRLVLAGPEAGSVQDDPEAIEILADLKSAYLDLEPEIQEDVAVVTLPMADREQNALMVNALQRASSVVVQNSLQEGFGLTISEAMWKRVPVLTNRRACGPRHQVRDGLDGRLVDDPEDTEELARVLDQVLADSDARDRWGRTAQRRVHDEFLISRQVAGWIRRLAELCEPPG